MDHLSCLAIGKCVCVYVPDKMFDFETLNSTRLMFIYNCVGLE